MLYIYGVCNSGAKGHKTYIFPQRFVIIIKIRQFSNVQIQLGLKLRTHGINADFILWFSFHFTGFYRVTDYFYVNTLLNVRINKSADCQQLIVV